MENEITNDTEALKELLRHFYISESRIIWGIKPDTPIDELHINLSNYLIKIKESENEA